MLKPYITDEFINFINSKAQREGLDRKYTPDEIPRKLAPFSFFDGFKTVIMNINIPDEDQSGGGESPVIIVDNNPIRFFDYDGKLVKSYSEMPDTLPDLPNHTNLKNGSWNYTLDEIKEQFEYAGTCDIGANYDTASGSTEITIIIPDTARVYPYLSIAINGIVTIDWGDGSDDENYSGNSLTSRKNNIHHEYSDSGEYTIKITPANNSSYSLLGTGKYPLLNKNSTTANENIVYANFIKSVKIGNSCVIGDFAFYYCYSLESVSIPTSVYSFGENAFLHCHSLKSIVIPNTVTDIGSSAFYHCYSLESVSIPNSVSTISGSMFAECNSLTLINIPISVTRIESFAFYHCYSTNFVLPTNITFIGNNAFSNCYSLKSIVLPDGLTEIKNRVFFHCHSLNSVVLPDNISEIGENAFSFCHSLTSIVVKENIDTIGDSAFSNCSGLLEFHIQATTPPIILQSIYYYSSTNVFSNTPSDFIIYVPNENINDYLEADNWSDYSNIINGE